MIYNFNLGIGWASSGVEYAQAYRAQVLRTIGAQAKFVFTDMFATENIEHMTKNIGFLDEEIIWLYTFFTDTKIAPVSYTLEDLKKTIGDRPYTISRNGKIVGFDFEGKGNFYRIHMVDEKSDLVHRVEMVENGCLIRKDYFTYCRIYSEYYAPLDGKAHLYLRRFFHEDGSVAYEEITDQDVVMYQFADRLICSKEELVGYMVSKLNLTEKDIVIIDRSTDLAQAILENAGNARIGSIIHADHFSEGGTTEENILWNNYYDYLFTNHKYVDFFVTSTEAQKELMAEQFEKYYGAHPYIVTIPVGSIKELKDSYARRSHALITASRLATEKHIDWLIEAVARVHESIGDVTFDIYGKGAEEAQLKEKITQLQAESYIRLMGQQKLDDIYRQYDAYIAGSMSEGFGLTLLEAAGSGLPLIGFDVRYGNPTFIDHEENGYLISVQENMNSRQKVDALTNAIIRLFQEADLEQFRAHSYEIAQRYLAKEVEQKWKTLIEKMI